MQQSTNVLSALIRRLWIIILGLILGGALGALVSQQMIPIYQSSVYLLVVPTSSNTGGTPAANVHEQANDYAQAYSKLATDPAVIGEAVSKSEVGVDPWDIRKVVNVVVSPGAPILQITASLQDAEDASTLANALGSGLSSFTEQEAEDAGYQAEVMAEAIPPTNPAIPNWPLNIAVGAAAGLLVGAVMALLWESLRQSREAWAERRHARRMEKEKQRRERQEEEERQRREREMAELEKMLGRYLELRSGNLQEPRQENRRYGEDLSLEDKVAEARQALDENLRKVRQEGGGRSSVGNSPPEGKSDEPQRGS